MVLTEEHIEEVGKKLVFITADALRSEKLTEDELSVLSGFVLDNIDNCKTQEELIDFLIKLNTQWPFFENIIVIEKGHLAENTQESKIEEIEHLIKEKKLDDAIKTAQDVIHPENTTQQITTAL